jgi:hypothetical protein
MSCSNPDYACSWLDPWPYLDANSAPASIFASSMRRFASQPSASAPQFYRKLTLLAKFYVRVRRVLVDQRLDIFKARFAPGVEWSPESTRLFRTKVPHVQNAVVV